MSVRSCPVLLKTLQWLPIALSIKFKLSLQPARSAPRGPGLYLSGFTLANNAPQCCSPTPLSTFLYMEHAKFQELSLEIPLSGLPFHAFSLRANLFLSYRPTFKAFSGSLT